MDPRAIILIIAVAIIIWWYFNIETVFWLAVLGLFIALVVLVFTILRAEGKIKRFTKWFRKFGKKYKKFEIKLFKFWDDL